MNNDETNPQLEAIAQQLADEIAYTHDAIMAVHKFAGQGGDPMVQLTCMKAAARMMQAQAAAALSLQRLKGGNVHRFTFVHETPPPTPKNLKTNRPPPAKGGIEEVWEDEEGFLHANPPDSDGRFTRTDDIVD